MSTGADCARIDPRASASARERAVRLAVVGARRTRQGTGPFLARQAAAAGAEVCAVLGPTPESAAAAAQALSADGIRAAAHTDLAALVAAEPVDAVILASPAGTHRGLLEQALELGLHVLCEKPLLAGPTDDARALAAQPAVAADLARSFAAAGKVLAENCQWPHTLQAFRALHPGWDPALARSFRMLLAPAARGRARWVETLSHPLSLLQAVLPGPATLADVGYGEDRPGAAIAELRFRYRASGRELACSVRCTEAEERPRPAEYAFDELLCRRRVQEPGYRFFFQSGPDAGAQVAAHDPMRRAVEAFLDRVATGAASADPALVERQALLAQLLEAHAG